MNIIKHLRAVLQHEHHNDHTKQKSIYLAEIATERVTVTALLA